ncbi:MAG TPA: YIP1 family protein [Candidatus Polarisedimenticolia bacterium]|nr:YIP1 family protein [Candidatus Polarisedimenticolia bacterium]
MNGPAEPAAPPPGDLGPLQALGRVARIFYAPRAASAEIRERPNWVFPLLLSVLFSFLLWGALFARPEWQQALRQSIAAAPAKLGELEKVQTLKAMQVAATVMALAAPILGNLFLAMLLWGIATLREGKAPFVTVFSFEVHAQMVTVVPQAIGLGVLVASRGGSLADAGSGIPFSLASLLPAAGVPAAARGLASAVDLFSVWYWALVLVGLPIVTSVPARRLRFPILVLWLASVIARAVTLTLAVSQP